jgi:hypothetical protein
MSFFVGFFFVWMAFAFCNMIGAIANRIKAKKILETIEKHHDEIIQRAAWYHKEGIRGKKAIEKAIEEFIK